MKEKLIIKNFGPIKDVELELGKFNILIGEQATGKSTVAKVLAVCKYFSYILDHDYGQNFLRGLESWGLSGFVNYGSTYISYSCEHYFFEATAIIEESIHHNYEDDSPEKDEYPTFNTFLKELSPSFSRVMEELKKLNPNKTGEGYGYVDFDWQPPTSFFQNEIVSLLDNPFYFPVERSLQSLFSLGKYSTANFYDKLYEYFARVDKISQGFKSDTIIEPLGITYKNENERGFVKSDKHDFIKLTNAASGYQSTIPVVLVLKSYNRTKRKGKTFIIEEPELNLFPNAQQKLMEYLVEQVNSYNNSFLINTHSPYILTSLNNMMYAWDVGQEKKEQVTEIVEEKYWLNPNEVKAYRMLGNGTCESLIAEDGLLMPEKIDEVSGIINKEYDRLFSIHYQEQEVEA